MCCAMHVSTNIPSLKYNTGIGYTHSDSYIICFCLYYIFNFCTLCTAHCWMSLFRAVFLLLLCLISIFNCMTRIKKFHIVECMCVCVYVHVYLYVCCTLHNFNCFIKSNMQERYTFVASHINWNSKKTRIVFTVVRLLLIDDEM